jgi:hypothetical protein
VNQWIVRYKEKSVVSFDTIWARIKAQEGNKFRQILGHEFTYSAFDSAITPSKTNQNIPRAHFEKKSGLLPFENTVSVQHLRGPYYLFAVLMDSRIRQQDW